MQEGAGEMGKMEQLDHRTGEGKKEEANKAQMTPDDKGRENRTSTTSHGM